MSRWSVGRSVHAAPTGYKIVKVSLGKAVQRTTHAARVRGQPLAVRYINIESGAWGRIRTTDTRIFNPLLYQLSYPG